MVTARLTNYRTSPRKMRLVANAIRGKKISDAFNQLALLTKRATSPLTKLLQSAVANAKNNFGLDADNLTIREIRVDGGIVMKRSMPRARGSAYPIRKRTSHVILVLGERPSKKAKKDSKQDNKKETK
jgi:large subunit ribosomal protein L22